MRTKRLGEPRIPRVRPTKPKEPQDLEAWQVKWDVHLCQTSLEELKEISMTSPIPTNKTIDSILDKLDFELKPVIYPDGTKYADEIVITGKEEAKQTLLTYIDENYIAKDKVSSHLTKVIEEANQEQRDAIR
jgi:hypothetical protein